MVSEKGGKKFLKKFWHLLWKDNSFKGWLLSIIFLFIVIKFIFFPFLSLVTGTSLPLAIVESCSMYHKGNLFSDFDMWWSHQEDKYPEFIINKLDFQNFPMKNGFNKGDILLIVRADPEKLEVGNIIIFNVNQRNPVIHRIVDIKEITENQLVGKAILKIAPYVGWIKLIFYEWQKPSSEKGLCSER